MMKIPSNIKTYRPAIETILSWMPDWISQHEFDQFAARECIMDRAWFMADDTVHLGQLGRLKKELDLLQHMIVAGLAESKTDDADGLVYYRAKPKDSPS